MYPMLMRRATRGDSDHGLMCSPHTFYSRHDKNWRTECKQWPASPAYTCTPQIERIPCCPNNTKHDSYQNGPDIWSSNRRIWWGEEFLGCLLLYMDRCYCALLPLLAVIRRYKPYVHHYSPLLAAKSTIGDRHLRLPLKIFHLLSLSLERSLTNAAYILPELFLNFGTMPS